MLATLAIFSKKVKVQPVAAKRIKPKHAVWQ